MSKVYDVFRIHCLNKYNQCAVSFMWKRIDMLKEKQKKKKEQSLKFITF